MSGNPIQRVIIMLADGARADVTERMLAAGELPNISRLLVEPGAHLQAVTSFPSTTGPAYLPFLTGCFPGTCNVPGIRWFDKAKFADGWSFDRYRSYVGFESFCMGSDIRPPIRTIFELVPDSYSIFNPIARGAGARNRTRMSRIWHWYYGHLTDRWEFTDGCALEKLRKVLSKGPRFVFTVFPGLDVYSHLSHPLHEVVIGRYRALDKAVEVLVDDLKKRDEWETTALFIVSDHGLSETRTHFCVNEFLDAHGLPAFYYPKIFDKRGKLSANMVSGNGMTHIYFKNSDGWARHTVREELESIAPGLIDDLLKEEAVGIVAVRNASGGIDILSRKGRAKARLDGQRLHYEVAGSDPFGYPALPSEIDPELLLKLTLDTEYADAPFQIAHLMTSPRSGDVIISATPGYDLRVKYEHPEHRASHGSLHSMHMRVPMITNIPFEKRPLRTVDIFPTVLKLLGQDIPQHIDGKALGWAR